MKTKHSGWIPIASFLLAVVLSMVAGPATSRLLARDPGAATGDCVPPAWAGNTAANATCTKFTTVTNTFNPVAPPPNMPALNPGEDALTECSMEITWTGKFTDKTCTNPDGTCTAVSHAVSIDATFTGSATIWLPNGAPKMLVDHENGHADICQAACDASCQLLKQDVGKGPQASDPQKGPDCETAAAAADNSLEAWIDTFFHQELLGDQNQEQAASDAYDTATAHGTQGNQKKEAKTQATNVSNAIFPKK